jgi:hypothetical protein
MNRFRYGQRVVVVRPLGKERRELFGYTGTVARLCRDDKLAWVAMDRDLPEGMTEFPATKRIDPSRVEPRRRDILMHPEECDDFHPKPARRNSRAATKE